MLESLTVGKLLARWERDSRREDVAVGKVYVLALHGNERFNDIMTRLGADHPAVIGCTGARAAMDLVELECRRRYGPAVQYRSQWPTILRQQMRRRK